MLASIRWGESARAFEADSEDLKRVIRWLKAIYGTSIVLQSNDARILKFYDLSTARTNHVVVVRSVSSLFVLSMTLREAVARDKTAFMQKVKRLVNRGARNLRTVAF